MINILFAVLFSFLGFAQNKVEVHEAELKRNPENVRARVQLARSHFDSGKFEKVIELLNPYTDQLDANGFLMLAMSYSNKKDFANEVRVLNIIAANEEENYKWQMLLAQAYLKQAGQNPNASNSGELMTEGIRHLRATMKMAPSYKPAFDLLLSTFLQQKAHNEARELLAEGISKFGARADLFKELCRLDAMDGYLVQAVEHCRESIKISPAYPDHYVYLVQALYDQKENIPAERAIVNAAKRFSKSEFVQWAAGTLFFKKKNYPVAARYFRAAVTAKPDSSRAQFGLAQSLFEQGQEAEALDFFIKACKSDPNTNEVFHTFAGRMKQTKNTTLAAKYVQNANNCR
jgi:predicted Zn-dependent protease